MEIVPVLDLKHGLVVRASRGDRHSYAPIVTPLSPSPEPLGVARGLMALHAFRRLYIADLDGIEGRDRNDSTVAALGAAFPGVEFWVDNGLSEETACRAWLARHRARLVVGSESQRDTGLARRLGPGAVLSLDFRGDAFQGPPALREDPGLWPEDVIVMTLARVGSGAGPDRDRLAEMRRRAADVRLWAAGGVRDRADLEALADLRVSGALVATALHEGRITPTDLDALALS
ncbi:HisA/HisF-related TIM barrel protein [Prosthecomicrobium sp. N25]|uniref:HisA/HisF-related TIM barrel protein n=1 Tax=Prosthecomicrobium sp. N25 TaxID=3129254 RepID=UPI003077B224